MLPKIFENCFGKDCLDNGHNRFPDPPESTTGVIFISKQYKVMEAL